MDCISDNTATSPVLLSSSKTGKLKAVDLESFFGGGGLFYANCNSAVLKADWFDKLTLWPKKIHVYFSLTAL